MEELTFDGGNKNLVVGSILGGLFPGGGMNKFSAGEGDSTREKPPVGKTLSNCCWTRSDAVAIAADGNNRNKEVTFKNCAPFTHCISEINNMQVDDAKNLDVMMTIQPSK